MRSKGRKMLPIILGVLFAVVVATVVVFMLLPQHPNVGDVTKFNRTFTAAEQELIATVKVSPSDLAAADCKEGMSCWVAFNRVVYDVSALPTWARGSHHGLTAGRDLTDHYLTSIHGVKEIQMLPVVGSYASGEAVDAVE